MPQDTLCSSFLFDKLCSMHNLRQTIGYGSQLCTFPGKAWFRACNLKKSFDLTYRH